jgi:membrane protease subunit HflC
MKKTTSIIIAIIVVIVVGSQSLFTIDMTEQAIVLELGRYVKTVQQPGLHAKIPFIQSVTSYDKRILVSDIAPGSYITQDKKRLVVDHITRWRITEPLKFYKTVRTEVGAKARLEPIVLSEMRDELAAHDFSDIISIQREPIMATVAARTQGKISDFGIELIDVRIKRADLPPEVQSSVFGRMQAERQRISLQYRAEGDEAAVKLRADADRQVRILQAEGYEENQKLTGEGDAEAIAIYAAAFEQDPEFYSFMRTLQAYSTLIPKDTTLVLGSDSELFQYLESPKVIEE